MDSFKAFEEIGAIPRATRIIGLRTHSRSAEPLTESSQVQDEERRRVARDLHDSTGQTLTALKMGLAVLDEKIKRNQCATGTLSELAVLVDQALQEIRTTSYLLHPPLLDEAGFNSAAQWYVDGFGKRSGIKVRLDLATKLERLPITIETALFRVLQESLTNVHRHSRALEVSIRFQYQTETVMLEIRDCGRGIPMEKLTRLREASSETGVGLAGLRERLNELNGKLEIESDHHGTSLRAIVPLPVIAPSALHGDSTGVAFCGKTMADALLMVSTTKLASTSGQAASGF